MLTLRLLPFPKYVLLDEADARAVAVAHDLAFTNVKPGMQVFHLPPQLLPFGLCESARVSTDTTGAAAKYRITLRKSNGMRTTAWHDVNSTSSFFAADVENDDDAYHMDIKTMHAQTGHDFRYRYFAALSLLSVTLEFDGAPPADFHLVFHTVNGVPKAVTPSQVADALDRKTRVDFVLPVITPTKRALAAASALENTSLAPTVPAA